MRNEKKKETQKKIVKKTQILRRQGMKLKGRNQKPFEANINSMTVQISNT